MADFVPSRPTHRLKILDKDAGSKSTVGAGWLNADGSMSIRLEPGCQLNYEDSKNYLMTLFPIDRSKSDGPIVG